MTDFLAAIEDPPGLLYRFVDGFCASKRNGRRRCPELALEQQKIHQAPEKHDGNANGALNKHAVSEYAKGKERPIQC
jgi:hypothetical protein